MYMSRILSKKIVQLPCKLLCTSNTTTNCLLASSKNIAVALQASTSSRSYSSSSNFGRRESAVSSLHASIEKTAGVDVTNFPPTIANTFFNICPQGYEVVIERLGKFQRTVKPGWFISIPIIDRLRLVDMREMTIQIAPQLSTTKDNVQVSTGGALYLQVIDSYKACYGARRPLVAAVTHAQSAMRTATGSVELDTLFHNRDVLNRKLVNDLSDAAAHWGLKPCRYELTDVNPDETVSHAMDSQSVAERKRRETILQAEAIKRRFELESEGKRIAAINVAEGKKAEVVLAAEAFKQKEILEAEGKAQALERFANALHHQNSTAAMVSISSIFTITTRFGILQFSLLNFSIAQDYVSGLTSGLMKSSTVFLPTDMSDVSKMMGTSLGILDTFAAKYTNTNKNNDSSLNSTHSTTITPTSTSETIGYTSNDINGHNIEK